MKVEGYSLGALARRIAPLFGLVVFLLAGYAVHRVFHEYHYRELRQAFQGIPSAHILAAACFAAGSYFMLTLYDVLGFRYAGVSLPYHRLALASFIGYSLSNNVGHSVLSGGAVRYRLYSAWGVDPGRIARVVTFCTVTGWLGFATMGGLALLLEPAGALPAMFPAHLHIPLGIALLALSAAYLAVSALGWGVLRWRGHELSLPGGRIAVAQILVGAVDLILTSAVFYSVLALDTPLGFPSFAGFFMIAIIAGLVSQVPGGLGVFETIMLAFLSPYASGPHLITAILLYRAIYYFLPLILAVSLLGVHEILNRNAVLGRFTALMRNLSPLIPSVFAVSVMAGGAILLFSGATPPAHNRITLLQGLVPLPMVELSHFLASLVGVLLLFLGRALQRRVDAAYWLTLALLASGAVLSLLKGLDYEEAVVLGVMLAALAPCHREFQRKSSLLAPRFGPGWVGTIAVIAASTLWLVFFTHKHVEYSSELWWQFAFSEGAPRALRASVGAGVLLAGLSLARLLSPAAVILDDAPPDWGRIGKAAALSGSTNAQLAFLGDKRFLFHDTLPAFVMYGLSGRCSVAMGDPVGDPAAARDLVWDFRDLCDRTGLMPVFYQVRPETLHLYADIGLSLAKFGEEAMVDLRAWSLDGASHRNERNLLHRMERDEVAFEIVERAEVPAILAELRQVSDQWLAAKNSREKAFSLGYFDETYLCRFRQAVLRHKGRIAAFANMLESGDGAELSVDLMRHRADAPEGAMEALFLYLMKWGAREGFVRFNLGMAPLSGIEGGQAAPLWNRFAAMFYEHGGRFYNFQGLRLYKEKFHPRWEPRYIASPGGITLAQVLAGIASLVNRGVSGTVMK
jgi:phosphatidylglycerol lysyltransferase